MIAAKIWDQVLIETKGAWIEIKDLYYKWTYAYLDYMHANYNVELAESIIIFCSVLKFFSN